MKGGGGVLQNQREHHKILTKYEAVHPTVVSENYSSSGMLNFDILSNIFGWQIHTYYI